MNWTLGMNQYWGGLAFITPTASNETDCGATWAFDFVYNYLGGHIDQAFKDDLANMTSILRPSTQNITAYANWYNKVGSQPLEPIYPWNLGQPNEGSVGGLPSVLISRQTVENGKLSAFIKQRLDECPLYKTKTYCNTHQLYQDITGNIGSPQDNNTSISEGFRSAIFHYIATY